MRVNRITTSMHPKRTQPPPQHTQKFLHVKVHMSWPKDLNVFKFEDVHFIIHRNHRHVTGKQTVLIAIKTSVDLTTNETTQIITTNTNTSNTNTNYFYYNYLLGKYIVS